MTRPIRLLPFLVLTACTASLDVPLGAQITCATDADCFNGQRCLLDIRLCVDAGQSCTVEVPGGFNSVGNGTTCTQRDGASGVCLGGQCLQSRCGDGYVDPSTAEQCDEGPANSDTKANGCRTDCIRGRCGDGILDDVTEVCDDGNVASGDGCRADCKKVETCGDAIIDTGEDCDDANENANDGCDQCQSTVWAAARIVGAGGLGGTTADASLVSQGPVAVDLAGNIYYGDTNCRILKIDPVSGGVAVIAGTGLCTGASIEGAIARGSPIGSPRQIAVNSRGVVHFCDGVYIRSIDPQTGRLHNVVGNGTGCGSAMACASGVTAQAIALAQVSGMAFDGRDNLYYSESNAHVVRVVPAGSPFVFVVMGTPFVAGSDFAENGPGSDTLLNQPIALAVNPTGTVFVSDYGNNRILSLEVTDDRTHRVAGNGSSASSPDGSTAATSSIRFPGNSQDLEVLRDGRLVFYETGKLRTVGTDGKLGTLAGTGVEGSSDGPALTSQLAARTFAGTRTNSVVFSENLASNLTPLKLRRIENGAISTIINSPRRNGQVLGAAPTGTLFQGITDLERAPNGDLYLANTTPPLILRLAAGVGDVEVYAGGGTSTDENVLATDVFIPSLGGIRALANGDLAFADTGAHLIRKIDGVTKRVTTLAGSRPGGGFSGDGGPATSARLNAPQDFDFASNGDMYILDSSNFRIRKVTASTGNISTVLGTGSSCLAASDSCGDGALATNATLALNSPRPHIRVAANGDVVFTDPAFHRVRMIVAATGIVQRIAGVQNASVCPSPNHAGDCGDGGAATSALLNSNQLGIAIDGSGLLIGDGRVRRLSALSTSATISTVYLYDMHEDSGDGGSASTAFGNAAFLRPVDGVLYFASPSLVRRVKDGVIDTLAGLVAGQSDGPAAQAELGHPFALAALPNQRWVATDGKPSGKVRMLDLASNRVSTVLGRNGGFGDLVLPGQLATYAMLMGEPAGIAYDGARNLIYVADRGRDAIRAIQVVGDQPASWTTSILLPANFPAGVDGPLASASIVDPSGIAYDGPRDVLWIADSGEGLIRRVDLAAGQVSTLGGQFEQRGYAGDGGPVADAFFDTVGALAVGPDGSLYIADTENNRVRRVAPSTTGTLDGSSIIDNVFGDGSTASSGSGTPARAFAAGHPQGLTFDGFGNLWVTTGSSVRIVAAGDDGIVTGEDTVTTVYGVPPRDDFPASVTICLSGVAMLPGDASAIVLDECLGYVVRLDRQAAP